jgi:hypothetical protein
MWTGTNGIAADLCDQALLDHVLADFSDREPGLRAKQNRLRHLLTIWRGVSSRTAICIYEPE